MSDDEVYDEDTVDYESDVKIPPDTIYVHIVPPEQRMTSHCCQLFEMCEAIGSRAAAIERGSPALVPTTGLGTSIDIAKKELIQRLNPYIVRRVVEKRDRIEVVEEWPIREMELPLKDSEILAISEKDIKKLA